MLATGLRPLPVPPLRGAEARARPVPGLLQVRPRPHRPAHTGARARRPGLRCAQDGGEMSRACRHISESVQLRPPVEEVRLDSWVAAPARSPSRPRLPVVLAPQLKRAGRRPRACPCPSARRCTPLACRKSARSWSRSGSLTRTSMRSRRESPFAPGSSSVATFDLPRTSGGQTSFDARPEAQA